MNSSNKMSTKINRPLRKSNIALKSFTNHIFNASKIFFLNYLVPTFLFLIFLAERVSAHCPLCTAGAAVAAGGASWLGVSKIVIGLFIGAFSMSLAIWFSKIPKKQYFPFQKTFIVIIIFLSTIFSILPFINNEHDAYPFFVSLGGNYGSLLNRTYLINYSYFGAFFGSALVLISPIASKGITKLRKGKKIPFQGTLITLLLLILSGTILQLSI